MQALKAAPAAPAQLHSHDGRVRLAPGVLGTIVLEHLCTVQDPSVLCDARATYPRCSAAGVTEWQGLCDGGQVSLGWDWLCLDDGALVVLATVAPRSNVMLLDRAGYDLAPALLDAGLWQAIQSLPWQSRAAHALAAGPDEGL
jgi:hypothetical protein